MERLKTFHSKQISGFPEGIDPSKYALRGEFLTFTYERTSYGWKTRCLWETRVYFSPVCFFTVNLVWNPITCFVFFGGGQGGEWVWAKRPLPAHFPISCGSPSQAILTGLCEEEVPAGWRVGLAGLGLSLPLASLLSLVPCLVLSCHHRNDNTWTHRDYDGMPQVQISAQVPRLTTSYFLEPKALLIIERRRSPDEQALLAIIKRSWNTCSVSGSGLYKHRLSIRPVGKLVNSGSELDSFPTVTVSGEPLIAVGP